MFDDPQRYCQFIVEFDETNQGGSADSLSRALAEADWVSDHALHTLTSLYQMGNSLVGEDAIALQRWSTHRVVYHVDPTTLDAIEHTRWDTTVIPGEIFRRLPHPDPVVVLPEPLYIPHDSGNWERYDAFAVTASRVQDGRRVLCSTHHPDAVNIGLHYYARLVDAPNDSGQQVRSTVLPGVALDDIIGLRLLTAIDDDRSMQERIDDALADIDIRGTWGTMGWQDRATTEQAVTRLTTLGLALLTYLCSEQPDLALAGPHGGTPLRPRTPGTPAPASHNPHVVDVGFRLGPALLNARHPHPESSRGTGSGHRTVAAHVRRAHTHTYRVGPGRAQRILKWLPPIVVNPQRDTNPDARTQAHAV